MHLKKWKPFNIVPRYISHIRFFIKLLKISSLVFINLVDSPVNRLDEVETADRVSNQTFLIEAYTRLFVLEISCIKMYRKLL